jgi:hypothetical protein
MGRLSSVRRAIAAAVIAGAATLTLASCENNLMTYFFKGILYQGWKVASWSTPAPVVAGETHEQGTLKRNGFPMNMAMGTNGKLHLVGWRVTAKEWIYTSMDPGAGSFTQTYTVVNATDNPSDLTLEPGIDLISDDVPYITYGVGDGFGNRHLYFQEYNAVSGWRPAEEVQSNSTSVEYAPSFVFFLASDYKPHLWYLADGTIYHTIRNSSNNFTAPAAWLLDVGWAAAVRIAPDDIAFVYTDSAQTHLYYRTWKGSESTTIWSAPTNVGIGKMTTTLDSNGAAYVCFGTYNPADSMNTAFYSLRCLTNSGGSWHERESINGNASAGPIAWIFPCAIDVARDRYGNEHLHMAYSTWNSPANWSVWYSYLEDGGWHAPQNLDTQHTNSFWTFPLIAVDPTGTVHVVYAWTQTELDRTMMYVRGTPAEPQNQ